jgi:hypothetical protein
MSSYDYDDYRDVTLADIEDMLRRTKDLQESVGSEVVQELQRVRGTLDRVEQALGSLHNMSSGRGQWAMIITILLGFILWRVW